MHEKSDAQLLRDYAGRGNELAFREIVERHADVIYSSALRQMTSPDLASDVAQSVFIDLARKASSVSKSLSENASLLGWLYRATRFAALTQLRDDRRRHARERHVMEQLNPASESAPDWGRIAPVLDEAMADLNEEDREALLLRFFKNQDFRTIGTVLGVSDDAAQKRVSRAVERLREFFSKRGVTIGASGLAVAISGNAVQAAPIGFALTISSALAGTTLASATTATAIKTVAMTTLQKSLITAVIVAAVGAGIYEAREASNLREQVESLKQQQQSAPADQLQQLTGERDNALRQLAELRQENERLNRNSAELIRLRGEVGRLRTTLAHSSIEPNSDDRMQVAMKSWVERVNTLQSRLKETPERNIPEFQFLEDVDWLDAVKDVDPNEDSDLRFAAAQLRDAAKGHFAMQLAKALDEYLKANQDELPEELSDLNPYFKSPVSHEIMNRYELIQQGKYNGKRSALVREKSRVDNDNTRIEISRHGYSHVNWGSPQTAGE